MSLGTIKNRHQKAVRSSPFALKLSRKKKKSNSESSKNYISTKKKNQSSYIRFRTGQSRPSISRQTLRLSKNMSPVGSAQNSGLPTTDRMNKFKLGDWLECSWKDSVAYSRSAGKFVGKLVEIRSSHDTTKFFFTLQNKQGVVLDQYTPMCKLRKINGIK